MFVSSHLMSEMALTAEHLIVIGRGRLIADTGMREFIAGAEGDAVRVRSTDPDALAGLPGRAAEVSPDRDGALTVSGLTTDQVGRPRRRPGSPCSSLTARQASLEEAFIDMTSDAVEFRAPTTAPAKG